MAGAIICGKTDENGFSWDNDWSWENSSNGFMIGSIAGAGAVIGGAWGGTHYALQNTGKMAIKTSINNLVNNPEDDFVKVGPKMEAFQIMYIQFHKLVVIAKFLQINYQMECTKLQMDIIELLL